MTLELETVDTAAPGVDASESPFDRQELIPWWDQEKLAQARVMVAGAGALGNEVLKNLALMGVGSLLVVDFDEVEDSNLSRAVLFRQGDVRGDGKANLAARRVRQLNPNQSAHIAAIQGDLVWEVGAGVYRHLDLVVGCLDNVEARRVVNEQCWQAGIPWIDGGMHALAGSVAVYDASPDRACYECGMDDESYRRARERYSCTGEAVKANIAKGREPTTQTTSALIAAMQCQEAIKLLHGLDSFAGRKVIYQGYSHNFALPEQTAFMIVQLKTNPHCLCHNYQARHQDVVELAWARAQSTKAADILQFAAEEMGFGTPLLELGREFAVEAICPLCGFATRLDKPCFRLSDKELACPKCQTACPLCGTVSQGLPDCPNCGQTDINQRRLTALHQLRLDRPDEAKFLNLPLLELGIPPLHLLQIRDIEGRQVVIEVNGDLDSVLGPDRRADALQTQQ